MVLAVFGLVTLPSADDDIHDDYSVLKNQILALANDDDDDCVVVVLDDDHDDYNFAVVVVVLVVVVVDDVTMILRAGVVLARAFLPLALFHSSAFGRLKSAKICFDFYDKIGPLCPT